MVLANPITNNSTNSFGPTNYTVDSFPGNGNFTSISAALAYMVAKSISNVTIFLRPGTYTENFTLPATINLAAWNCDALTPNVTIIGKITCTDAGSRSISGIRLQTNSDFALAVTGSAATVVNLINCYVNCVATTGISYTSSSSSSRIFLYTCSGNLSSTAATLFSASGSGKIFIWNTYILAAIGVGNSSTASTISSGQLTCENCNFEFPITGNGTSIVQFFQTVIFCSSNAATGLIFSGSGGNSYLINSYISSGSSTALTINVGGTLQVANSFINSNNTTAAISGSGVIQYSNISFGPTSNASTITTTTQQIFQSNNTYPRTATAVSYAVLSTDYIIAVTSNAAARTITLPAAPSTNQVFIIKDEAGTAQSANNITVSGNGSNIDGAATFVINTNFGSLSVYFNGTQYFTF